MTNFGEVASGSVGAAADDGTYGEFNRKVAKLTEGAYKGPMAKLGGRPRGGGQDDRRRAEGGPPEGRAIRSRRAPA